MLEQAFEVQACRTHQACKQYAAAAAGVTFITKRLLTVVQDFPVTLGPVYVEDTGLPLKSRYKLLTLVDGWHVGRLQLPIISVIPHVLEIVIRVCVAPTRFQESCSGYPDGC